MKPTARIPGAIPIVSLFFLLISCTTMSKHLTIKSTGDTFPAGTIIDARTGHPVTFDELREALAGVRVIYVGETHTNREHHRIQSRLIEALHGQRPDLSVGMVRQCPIKRLQRTLNAGNGR